MKTLLCILAVSCLCQVSRADTIYSATITVTNAAGTTNGQTITFNGSDVRTWTNSVFDITTQIRTNNTQSGAFGNLLAHVGSYQFSGAPIVYVSSPGFKIQSNAWFSVVLSAGWGTVVYDTNTTGPGFYVHLPITDLPANSRTNEASRLVEALGYSTNALSVGSLSTTNPIFYGLLTVTNPATGKQVTGTNGVLVADALTITGSGTNLIGYSRLINAAGGHFLFQPTDGPITNSDDGGVLTNLNSANLIFHTNQNQITPDFSMPVQLISTNAAFVFLTPVGVDGSKKTYQRTFAFVTNTTAAAVQATMPANIHLTGVPWITNLTRFEFECYAQEFTNCDARPIF